MFSPKVARFLKRTIRFRAATFRGASSRESCRDLYACYIQNSAPFADTTRDLTTPPLCHRDRVAHVPSAYGGLDGNSQ
jgi:hypothetical protein